MRRKVVAAVAVVLVVIVAWLWHGHRRTSTTTATSGSGATGSTAHGRDTRAAQTPATLSGRVTNKAGGNPLAGATVSIAKAELGAMILPSQAPTLVVTTNASGTWSSAVAPGTYIVAATSPGFFPGRSEKLVVGAGEQRGGVDLALEAGGTLVHGTVTDVGGGPIAGARITVHEDDELALGGRPDYVTLTGQDGTYQLTMRDGSYNAIASDEDYTKETKDLEVHGKAVTLDFQLIPGGVIKGKVVARDNGQPMAGAWIDVRGKRGQWGIGEAVSDADGNFTLRSLHSGAISLTAQGRGFASQNPTVVELGIGEQVDGITIVVDRAFSISGKIVDKQDPKKGVAGVLVGGFAMASQQLALAHEPTDKEGAFEIVGVRPASYTLAAFGEDSVPDIGKNVEVVDKDVKDIIIEVEAGVTLAGRVEPPGRASVRLTIDGEIGIGNMFQVAKTVIVHADSDATGAFELQHVPSGKLIVIASTDEGDTGKLPITVADTDQRGLVVQLEPRASISGTVVDTSGAPAEGARVDAMIMAEKASFDIGGRMHSAKVQADGSFRIVGLDDGKVTLTASWGWGDRFVYRDKDAPPPIELAKGEHKTGVKLTVPARDGVIRGQVLDADRKPAGDAWVTAHRESPTAKDTPPSEWAADEGNGPVLTDASGRFTIDHLKKGTYRLVAEGARGASRGEKADAKTGDTVTIEMTTLGTLAGHVTSGGAPVTPYDLSCRGPAGTIDRRITMADGSYSLEHLPPGSYTCSVSADKGTGKGTAEVPAGPATLDLALVPWSSITGTVVSVLSGQAVPNITVIAGGLDGRGFAEVIAGKAPVTDASGRFTVERVPAGSGSVTLMPQTGSFDQLAHRDYTVGEGQRVDLGAIKIVPPRNGDAGTFGLVAQPKDGKLVVVTVAPGGPAEQAGMLVGDAIVALDGHAVSDVGAEMAAQLLSSGRIGVGAQVALTLERGTTVTLTAAKW